MKVYQVLNFGFLIIIVLIIFIRTLQKFHFLCNDSVIKMTKLVVGKCVPVTKGFVAYNLLEALIHPYALFLSPLRYVESLKGDKHFHLLHLSCYLDSHKSRFLSDVWNNDHFSVL